MNGLSLDPTERSHAESFAQQKEATELHWLDIESDIARSHFNYTFIVGQQSGCTDARGSFP